MNNENEPLRQLRFIQQKIKINYWMTATIILGISLITVIGLFAVNHKATKDKQYALRKIKPQPTQDPINFRYQVQASITPQITFPLPNIGYEQRINGTLKFGYSYPVLYASLLRAYTIRLKPDPKAELLKEDLMCSASGVGGTQDCQNTKIEDFTNSLGFKGFKIYRTKTITGLNSGIYYDAVYVFPLQRVVKDESLSYYDGVLFFLDTIQPTQVDLSTLEEGANSFFRF